MHSPFSPDTSGRCDENALFMQMQLCESYKRSTFSRRDRTLSMYCATLRRTFAFIEPNTLACTFSETSGMPFEVCWSKRESLRSSVARCWRILSMVMDSKKRVMPCVTSVFAVSQFSIDTCLGFWFNAASTPRYPPSVHDQPTYVSSSPSSPTPKKSGSIWTSSISCFGAP